jgi:hypothetical protein
LDEVERHKSILFSKLSNVITNSAKKKVWDTICTKINAANQTDYRRRVKEMDNLYEQHQEAGVL